MKKVICLLLSLLMVLSFAACSETEEPASVETTQQTQPETTEATEPEVTVVPLDSFYMDYKSTDMEEPFYLQVGLDGEGGVSVEYKTALGRKKATKTVQLMEQLATLYEEGKFSSLNGQEVYEEGEGAASMYISRGEESCSFSYYGAQIPEDYKALFDEMAEYFKEMLADVSEYVPTPQMGEGLDEAQSAVILEILNASGIAALDSLAVNNVAKDEFFGQSAGLSGYEGIASCTSCTALMMTVPYSLVVVTVEEGTETAAVAADFTRNLDWAKWVCVMPSNATIAVKDNMALCLMGQDEMYFGTLTAIEEAGWNVIDSLKNPN